MRKAFDDVIEFLIDYFLEGFIFILKVASFGAGVITGLVIVVVTLNAILFCIRLFK